MRLFGGGLTVVLLFHFFTVLPMKKNVMLAKQKMMDISTSWLISQHIGYIARTLFELSPTLAVLPQKPVEQELIDVEKIDAFRGFKISERICHIIGVFNCLNKRNKAKESKAIVPPSHIGKILKRATCVLENNPEDDDELYILIKVLSSHAAEFYLNLSELKPREKKAQDLQIYDSLFNPFSTVCGDIPEALLIKSGYVKDQLNSLVDLLKKFHEENKIETCKKVVSPLHLALVIKGAEGLIKGRANLRKNLDDIISLDKLIKCAKTSTAKVGFEVGKEHIGDVMFHCFYNNHPENEKPMELIVESNDGDRKVYSSNLCDECKDRTTRLISQYNTLSREVERFNAELDK